MNTIAKELEQTALPPDAFEGSLAALDAERERKKSEGVDMRKKDDQPFVADRDLSLVAIASALARYGMTMKATRNGSFRIVCAELTRSEALRLNALNARDYMHFTPHDGNCPSCKADIVAQYGIHAIASGMNVTGCRSCCTSYCD